MKGIIDQIAQEAGYLKLTNLILAQDRFAESREDRSIRNVLGLLKYDDSAPVCSVPNCAKESSIPIVQELLLEGSTVFSGEGKVYNGLSLNGYNYYRVFRSHNELARRKRL